MISYDFHFVKIMLTVPNHHLLLHVPKMCSKRPCSITSEGIVVRLTMPFLKMVVTFAFLHPLEPFPNLSKLQWPHDNMGQFSQHCWMEPVWSHGFDGLKSSKSSLTWLLIFLLEPCFSAQMPKRPCKWRLRQRRHYMYLSFLCVHCY